MRKVILLLSFFFVTPFIFVIAVIYLLIISYHKPGRLYYANKNFNKSYSYAALPLTNTNFLSATVYSQEGREEMLRQFLNRYSSPLEPYAGFIIETADKYGLDFRLIPAIAMQESNLCQKIPANSHNCWGFGIYGSTVTRFENYPSAIETVTRTLAVKYKDKGLVTPEQIMSMYTPSSNGSWARSVNHFMKQLE